ncbi:hypothetical protein CERZMDRAFT_101271 [Cercospora zeae-maydis SCOH1-5]|uniref:Uncharacterized protein n=1 Tax=Cercospora zeae-maydis SCOH1-5 TaxID=717836 RepID=A0A6A6F400_9PEZI|nr:hypothetical protein CERZMDRAFT_101271 [Cercospora zeae-maydis SCOH1-5]
MDSTMQSSPPVRAWAHTRRDSQPESEYSLDLAALDLDDPEDTDTRIPEPKVDHILSEDIDGPSDFTQNMDAWMRGASIKRGTLKKTKKNTGTMTSQTILERSELLDREEILQREEMERNELREHNEVETHISAEVRNQMHEKNRQLEHEKVARQSTELKQQEVLARDFSKDGQIRTQNLLQVPGRQEDELEGGVTESHHTAENSPPTMSILERSHYEEGFSSEWQTDGEGSPPQPPNHKHFYQPTVEDYYSELSPARQNMQQSLRGRSVHNSTYSAQKHSPPKNGSRSPGRASSQTLSPSRPPTLQRTSTRGRYSANMDHESRLELEDQFKQLDAKCTQLEHLNVALGQALEEEKKARKEEQNSHESFAAEAARREQDLVDMKQLAHRHNAEFRREFGELKEQLLNQQKLTDLARSGENGRKQSHDAEIEHLRRQLDSQRIEHEKQCKTFEADLAAVRRGRDQAEKAALGLREELEAEREHHDAERQRFRTELQQAHDDEAAISELERELLQSKSEIENHKTAKIEAEEEIASLREQLASAKQTTEHDISRTSTERARAVELAASLQRQMQELKQQLRDQQSTHKTELEHVRSQQNASSQTSAQELDIVRTQLEAQQSELNMAVIERDEARDALAGVESKKQALETQITNLESVNVALDAKVSETIRKREQYWRSKLEEANRERELMARTLMHQWGRQEVAAESPQMYAYKYERKKGAEDGKENREPRTAL